MEERGFRLEMTGQAAGDYVFFWCRGGPEALAPAWTPILRSQLASVLAEVLVGPLASRWLARYVAAEARARRYAMGIGVRDRALQMARQLVEAPPAEPTPGVSETAPAGGGPTNLARWQGHLTRLLQQALAEHCLMVAEAVALFPAPSFAGALRRAAAAAVQELVIEREEQRASLPWRSLWLGPPPRAYEVHVLRTPDGAYQVLDRWGEPAGRRWLGDAPRPTTSEEAVLAHLVRLGPRRIVVHLPEESSLQAAVRAAFPGRVHACRGCPRCLASRRGRELPSP